MREHYDCEHVAIKTLFDPDQIVRAGAKNVAKRVTLVTLHLEPAKAENPAIRLGCQMS